MDIAFIDVIPGRTITDIMFCRRQYTVDRAMFYIILLKPFDQRSRIDACPCRRAPNDSKVRPQLGLW